MATGMTNDHSGSSTGLKCLNLGSGQRPFPKPWINIDIQPKWNPDIVADIRDLSQFENNSADLIVLWHAIEHFELGEADPMIGEAQRLFWQGGRFLVATLA